MVQLSLGPWGLTAQLERATELMTGHHACNMHTYIQEHTTTLRDAEADTATTTANLADYCSRNKVQLLEESDDELGGEHEDDDMDADQELLDMVGAESDGC